MSSTIEIILVVSCVLNLVTMVVNLVVCFEISKISRGVDSTDSSSAVITDLVVEEKRCSSSCRDNLNTRKDNGHKKGFQKKSFSQRKNRRKDVDEFDGLPD